MVDIVPYEAPASFANETVELIWQRMINTVLPNGSMVKDIIDVTQAGFFYDSAYPSAVEKAQLVQFILNEIIQNTFPQYAYGTFLDYLATMAGLTREAATKAITIVAATGVSGTVIPLGFKFASVADYENPSVEFETLAIATIPIGGTININCRAVLAGELGNVAANQITLQSSPLAGITSNTNVNASYGGADLETDDELRDRILLKEASTLGGGSKDDYRMWAEEVDGVGRCYVMPEWQGAGTGTVKLLILNASLTPAAAPLIADVVAYISPATNDGKAPIGAIVTVQAPLGLSINITYVVWLDVKLTDIATVNSQFATDIQAYFYEAKEVGYVYYKSISKVLLSIIGVLNHTSLTTSLTDTAVSYTAPAGPLGGLIVLTSGCLNIAAGTIIRMDSVNYTVLNYNTVTKTIELVGGPVAMVSSSILITIGSGLADYTVDIDQYPVIGTIVGTE